MNSQAKLRNDYFSAKGLGSPPSSQIERRVRAESLVKNQIPPLFEAALMLFDPSEDHNDPDWLQLMGWVYSQKIGNPFFDTDKANLFFSRASDILASSENQGDQVEVRPWLLRRQALQFLPNRQEWLKIGGGE